MNDDAVITSYEDFEMFKVRKPPVPRSEFVKKVVEYTKDGVFVTVHDNANKAATATGIDANTIRNICTGHYLHSHKRTGEKIFLYRGDDIRVRLRKIEERQNDYKYNHPHVTRPREVWEYTLGGRLLFKYPTGKEAAKVNKVSVGKVYNCCKGKRLFVDKRIFMYPEEDIKERVKKVKAELYKLSNKKPRYREVDMYSLDGEFLQAFPSASAASRELNLHVSDVTRCCNGGDKYSRNKYTVREKIFLWIGDSISDRLELINQLKNKDNVK